jgi:uncharacterized protein YyaL (SSP411 family)
MNRLAQETSPYLLQHKDNPVDWYPWGEEAFEKARAEDKPVLLSVGYSACHWCHVMERESFEDEETARLMNEHYVNVKVDREERPDVDSIYMSALQAMTRGGGWPMTVFMTPDGSPFYAGTYFPPEPRHGMPAFRQVLAGLANAYTERHDEVLNSAQGVREYLRDSTSTALPATAVSEELLDRATASIVRELDTRLGGFGGAPKFPQPMNLEALLRRYGRTGDRAALSGLETTLRAMANGGIYDQLGGGFARYSVDAHWLVPHFEKMLYDNALLARLYTEAYTATGDGFYRRIAEETLDYVARDLKSPEGGFYSAEDADSEGEEGKFYVWTPDEIRSALTSENAEFALRLWDVTERGNFEGKNILHVPRPPEAVAAEFGLSEDELTGRIAAVREKLFAEREGRVRPGRDEKVLASWNGLMLRAFALAARVFGREDYRRIAEENASFVLDSLVVEGGLRRSYKDGQARFNAYLEDHAAVADGLLALYETTLETRWLREAVSLADAAVELFWDGERGAFFDTPVGHEELITRPRDLYDNATPSGNSMIVDVLVRLAALTERAEYRERAEAVLRDLSGFVERLPGAFGRLLSALDFHLSRSYEVAIVGEPGGSDTEALLGAVHSVYVPNKVVAGGPEGDGEAVALVPFLADRPQRDGKATAYICVGYACQAPTTDPGELKRQLTG